MKDAGPPPASLRVGRLLVGGVRLAVKIVPASLRKRIEDRIFYGIFNQTRVMNDNYGWRPGQPASYTTRRTKPRE
ncbi:MAG: hypothetical protein AAFV53_15970 [Myxococcota bacterium]